MGSVLQSQKQKDDSRKHTVGEVVSLPKTTPSAPTPTPTSVALRRQQTLSALVSFLPSVMAGSGAQGSSHRPWGLGRQGQAQSGPAALAFLPRPALLPAGVSGQAA